MSIFLEDHDFFGLHLIIDAICFYSFLGERLYLCAVSYITDPSSSYRGVIAGDLTPFLLLSSYFLRTNAKLASNDFSICTWLMGYLVFLILFSYVEVNVHVRSHDVVRHIKGVT